MAAPIRAEPIKQTTSGQACNYAFLQYAVLLALVLLALFWKGLLPGETLASNDGPLGAMVARHNQIIPTLTGYWQDLNWLGTRFPTAPPSITSGLRLLTSPVVFSKIFYPASLYILGICAWFCFRQWKLRPLACTLAGLSVVLSSHFFSTACWGVAAQIIGIAMEFVAVGLLADLNAPRTWLRVIVAGVAVGMGIMEAYDIGAIFSLYVAAFAVYAAWRTEGTPFQRLSRGVLRVAVVAICAGLTSMASLTALISTQIQGTVGTEKESKEEKWDFVTQWSFPPSELPSLIVPGLFGYRMDTPRDVAYFPNSLEGGAYWGAVGRMRIVEEAYDKWAASGGQGEPPRAPGSAWRFTGGGEYAGVLVVLVAFWAVLQAFRKKESPFSLSQRRFIWFWSGAALVSLLFAFGRHAPFYEIIFHLPYFSTIRNTTKYLHCFHWCLAILFAYGIDGLVRAHLEGAPSTNNPGLRSQFKGWWSKAAAFDKRWVKGLLVVIGLSVFVWLFYAGAKPSLEKHIENTGYYDAALAAELASFSIKTVGWYLLFLIASVGLLLTTFSGWFRGGRGKLAAILFVALTVVDLARADLPWIIVQNYKEKYASNPVLDFLARHPEQHRVALFPLDRFVPMDKLPRELQHAYSTLNEIYRIEWMQHQFQYYNIQCLDIIQMPRVPADLEKFENAVGALPLRRWELTNTRYLLGPAMLLDLLNQQLDASQHRFRAALRFDLVPRAGVAAAHRYEEITTEINTNGAYAVFEFTGALPRAKLFSNWRSVPGDSAALEALKSPDFNPQQSVIVSKSVAAPPASAATTNKEAGTAEITSYWPKKIVLQAKPNAQSLLLLDDKYDPNWRVSVDGKPAELLRCNYIARGVELAPGEHTVIFEFAPSNTGLYVSLGALAVGFGVIGLLTFSRAWSGHT
jgi:hypothetical protein